MANVPISAFTVPANTVGIGATGYSLTGSASASFMDLAGTWNTSGTPTAIKLNITDTASNAASLLMDLQVGGLPAFNIQKSGVTRVWQIGTSSLSFCEIGGSNQLRLRDAGVLAWTTGGAGGTVDLQIGRRAAANLRLGAADAAAPVAQTLSVQSVVAGTTNTAGTNLTITGSQGTGTGAGGSIVFQVAPAGSSGSAQNALATALTIRSDTSVTSPGVSFLGGLSFGAYNAYSVYLVNDGAAGLRVQVNNSVFSAWYNGSSQREFVLSSDATLAYSSTTNPNATTDVKLARDTTNTLALKNAANAQEFRVYKTTTGTVYKALRGDNNLIKISGEAFADGAGANAGTLANSPVTGNPTKWIPIDDNGTTRYIPAW